MADVISVWTESHALLDRYARASAIERRSLIGGLAPRPEDHAAVFRDDIAPRARRIYAELWRNPPAWVDGVARLVHLSVAPVEDLRCARHFPGGYQDVLPFLKPATIWAAWELAFADGRYAYNGLVKLDGRFVWFPKPWLVLPPRAHQALAIWTD
jgi:hypothetical protein